MSAVAGDVEQAAESEPADHAAAYSLGECGKLNLIDRVGTQERRRGVKTRGNGVATDAIGDVFVAGSTSGGLDGNVQAGIYDFFVSKIDPEGVKQ